MGQDIGTAGLFVTTTTTTAPPAAATEPAYRYAAFISYRHAPEDRRWAMWLHRALETYRVPRRLQRSAGLPPRIGRCFRDEEELPASADLSAEIDKALAASRFLIVVCSPRTPASEWVNQEVVRFREMGRHDRILALLIEGEPADSFPPGLREIRRAVTDAAGLSRAQVEKVEPLAADVRPTREQSRGHLGRMARLRLLACVLGVPFDDLRQREQERRARRLVAVSGALAAVLLVVATLAAVAVGQRATAVEQRSRADANAARADASATRATAEAANARTAEAAVRRALSAVYVERGRAAADEGEDGIALLWYVRALRAESADPVRRAAHRARIGVAIRYGLGPVDLPAAGPAAAAAAAAALGPRRRLYPVPAGPPVVADYGPGGPTTRPLRADGPVQDWAVLRGGRRVLTLSRDTLRLWDADSGEPVPLDPAPPPVRDFDAVVPSPAGDRFAAIEGGGGGGAAAVGVRLWDARTGAATGPRLDHPNISGARFDPLGLRLMTVSTEAGGGQTVRIWDAATGSPTSPAMTLPAGTAAVAVDPAARWIITIAGGGAGGAGGTLATTECRDVATGRTVPLGPDSRVKKAVARAAAFSSDGRAVAVWGGGQVHVFDTATGAGATMDGGFPSSEAQRLAGGPDAVAFGPDGRAVAAVAGRYAAVWDARTGHPVGPGMAHPAERLVDVCFSPDGAVLVTRSYSGFARAWDAGGARLSRVEPPGDPRRLSGFKGLAFSPDGARLVTFGGDDRAARVWDARSCRPVAPPMAHRGEVAAAEFSPDGRRVATGSEDGTARVWDAATGVPVSPPLAPPGPGPSAASGPSEPPPRRPVAAVMFSPDGRRLLTRLEPPPAGAARDERDQPAAAHYVWEVATGRPLDPPLPPRRRERVAAVSRDLARALFVSDGAARVWDLAAGRPLGRDMPAPSLVALSPDGRRVATANGPAVHVWDVDAGRPVGPPVSHAAPVSHLGFSGNGRTGVSASADMQLSVMVRTWDAAAGLSAGRAIRPGLPDWMSDYALDGSGQRLVTIHNRANRLHVWDAGTGDRLTPAWGIGSVGSAAAFRPDGLWLAGGGYGGFGPHVWDLSPDGRAEADLERLAELIACRRLDDTGEVFELDADEWVRRFDAARAAHPDWFPPPAPPPGALLTDPPAGYRAAAEAWAAARSAPAADTGDRIPTPLRLAVTAAVDLMAGRAGEACAAAEVAAELDPDDGQIQVVLAAALVAVGQTERASRIVEVHRHTRCPSLFALILGGGRGKEPGPFADGVRDAIGALRRQGFDGPAFRQAEAALAPAEAGRGATRPATGPAATAPAE